MEKKVTGKEVRYTLLQNNINLSWLSHHANEAIRKIVDNIENSPSITDREKT